MSWHRQGVPKSEIRFVAGVGAHRPLRDEDIAKKLGADIAAEYEVTNHNFMGGDLRAFGNLENGMPNYFNRVVADADFKSASAVFILTVPSVLAAARS